jgi:hypothetical protein
MYHTLRFPNPRDHIAIPYRRENLKSYIPLWDVILCNFVFIYSLAHSGFMLSEKLPTEFS